MLTNQSSWTDCEQILHLGCGISVIKAQTSLPQNVLSSEERGETVLIIHYGQVYEVVHVHEPGSVILAGKGDNCYAVILPWVFKGKK